MVSFGGHQRVSQQQFSNLLRVIIILTISAKFAFSQDFNYLTYVHQSAMEMQYTFEVSINYYGQYLNNAAEQLSRALSDRVFDKMETISTYEEGYVLQGCILQTSTVALALIFDVVEQMEPVNNRTTDFHQSVLRELMEVNILMTDFDTFYYQFNVRLQESYRYLNDVLLINMMSSLQSLIDADAFLVLLLETCLQGVQQK